MFTADRRFVLGLALAAVVLAAIPGLIISLQAPQGSSYIGQVYNTDDHMVYAAWMRQAMDGHLLFDNRFTTDAQPGLTIHLYFFVLGLIAKVTGISFAMNLARLIFSFVFVLILHRLVSKLEWDTSATRLGTALPLIAGGVGFLSWHNFGNEWPIDVWQPEVFVFPSMLSNGLFMVSLCLISMVFCAVLEARERKGPMLWGAACMLLLMNIHSYDVLLVALVLIGFLASIVVQKQLTKEWLFRAILIGAGAIPAALWFVYVLRNDPVFQARAATETFSPNFQKVLLGLILPMVLAITGLALRKSESEVERKRWSLGLGIAVFLLTGLYFAASGHKEGYFLSLPVWLVVFAASVAASALLSSKNLAQNLFTAWALVGTSSIYCPALFQRKLAMGLAIPWSVLAVLGILSIVRAQELSVRRLVTGLAVLILGATSLRWIGREIFLARANVSNTTLHPVYLGDDEQRILAYLSGLSGKNVVIAMPGVPTPLFGQGKLEEGSPQDLAPLVPDLNPIASGLAGVYTFAGHWSETPDYTRKRMLLSKLFLADAPPAERLAKIWSLPFDNVISKSSSRYIIAPNPAYLEGVFDFSRVGEVVVDGPRYRLIKVPGR